MFPRLRPFGREISRHADPESPPPRDVTTDRPHSDTARLWLSEQQWMGLLTRVRTGVAREACPGGLSEATGDREHARHAPDFLCLVRLGAEGGPAGERGMYQVSTRNISAGGIGFVHDRELQRGVRATVALQPREGPGLILSARVAWCRALPESAGDDTRLFQVGVQFDQPVDVDPFIYAA